MNLKLFLILSFVLLQITYISADIELGVNIGYGFGLGLYGDDWFGLKADWLGRYNPDYDPLVDDPDDRYNYETYDDLNVTFGNGIKLDVDFTLFFNNTLGFLLRSGISVFGGYTCEQIVKGSGTNYDVNKTIASTTSKIKSNYLPINIGLKFKNKFNRLSIYSFIAPGIYFPFGVKGEWVDWYIDPGDPIENKKDIDMLFQPGFGVSAGFGAKFNLTQKLDIIFEFNPTYAFAILKEVNCIQDDYDWTPIEIKYYYEKDAKKLKDDIIDDDNEIYKYYIRGRPKYSLSSLSGKVGLLFNF